MYRALSAVILLMAATPSGAVVKTYEGSAVGFNFVKSNGPGNTLPVPQVSLRFLVDIDIEREPFFKILPADINFRLLESNFPGSENWSAVFIRFPNGGYGSLQVGYIGGDACNFANGDFCFTMGFNEPGVPSFVSMIQLRPDMPSSSTYSTTSGRVSFREVSNVVPEPESWALLIAGFGLVGAVLRRRRAQTLA